MKRLLSLLFFILVCAFQSNAQVDTRFTYQGVLRDTADRGTVQYDFLIRLYDGADGGAVEVAAANELLSEEVVDGVFVLELDYGTEVFASSERWLEFSVRRSGEAGYQVLTPRQRITSVPVSMVADIVDWSSVENIPTGFADGDDGDTLAALNCADTQVSAWSSGLQAWTCEDPMSGPQGPQGDPGPTGMTGPQGPQGDPGLAGAQGPQGDPGPMGMTGAQGPQGDPGPMGMTGAQGPQGDPGPVGTTGAQGPQGDPGPMGMTGAQGPQGDPGPVGMTGAQGPQGDPGPMGMTGAQGPQGDPGPMGMTGAQGPQGDPGPTGMTGAQGPQGDPGADGNGVLSGSGSPSAMIGADGDFYLDTSTYQIYGPKTGGAWGSGTSLQAPGISPPADPFPGSNILVAGDIPFLQSLWSDASKQGSWTKVYDTATDSVGSTPLRAAVGARPAFVFVEMTNGSRFGGYTQLGFPTIVNTSSSFYRQEDDSFIFALDTNEILPVSQTQFGTFQRESYGPTWGGGHDIFIAGTLTTMYCNVSHSYAYNGGVLDFPNNTACNNLAGVNGGGGSHPVTAIEVYVLH